MCGVYCVKTFSALSDEESGKFSLFQINIEEKRMTEKMCFNRSLTKSQTGVWIHPQGGKGEIRVKKLKLCSASALSAKYPFKQTNQADNQSNRQTDKQKRGEKQTNKQIVPPQYI